jgi:quinol-cytochrome oxidoreductase complex cytochrome b subunit
MRKPYIIGGSMATVITNLLSAIPFIGDDIVM